MKKPIIFRSLSFCLVLLPLFATLSRAADEQSSQPLKKGDIIFWKQNYQVIADVRDKVGRAVSNGQWAVDNLANGQEGDAYQRNHVAIYAGDGEFIDTGIGGRSATMVRKSE